MRLLHTSDWHLGRSFHGEGLIAAQAAHVDHLVETVVQQRVDAVLVAGDVYDRALPSVDAVALADEAFHRLAATGARVVVTSGNHDSARRLGFNSRLVDLAGVHLRTSLDRVGEPVVLEDEHGPVAVHGLPYLDPDVARVAWDLPSRSHAAALGHALGRVRADLATRPRGTRSVVLAHAFVTGGEPSDSERDIAVGGVSSVAAELFSDLDYVALGHLHGRATLSDSVRYSGSPIAYSFSEARHRKGSWLVDLGASGVEACEFVDAPVARSLARLSGTIEDLLLDPALAVHEGSWVQATLTDARRPVRAMERLRARFPHALALRFAPEGGEQPVQRTPVEGRTGHAVALDFVDHVRGEGASAEESALLREAFECCGGDRDLVREAGAS
ncbi:exonuclease SbcCD subunit D [Nocardioides aurantiacus]|uniref:Nuclease SbcCD subunit D n=1 Tax=Nocardioides aurantiacus TaxID=86796 RepID=A0A3N2CTC4_9ACTN|nr:exonuclease SbcCD subunit D [Nocardioides aurantiacus]ROR90783.1 exodeoxyribonuclease I subunit D [Nocardioides aurantiacus]